MTKLLFALLLMQGPAPLQSGVVTGKILLMDGSPGATLRVAAMPVPDPSQPPGPPVLSSIAQTDSSGNYRLENVPPGRYYITAGLIDRPMYYPGVEGSSTATIVNVTGTVVVSGIDFRLPRPVNLKVSGRVVGLPAASPLPTRPTITLLPRSQGSAVPFPRTPVNADSTFEIANVPPGTYSISVTGAGTATTDGIAIITVEDKDLTDLNVAMIDTAAKTKQEGLDPAWSLAGAWTAVIGDERAGVLHASGLRSRSEIDASGKVIREVPFLGGFVRLARFSGVPEPVFLTAGIRPIEARTASGTLLWSYPDAVGFSAGDMWTVDLDGDQSDEVIIGYGGATGVHVLSSKGQLLWKSTAIGNVWHVAGGDVRGNGKPQVVTTSATGKVHIFNDDGTAKIDLDAGVYANMVRVGKILPGDSAATIIAGGTASDNKSATLTALTADGTKKWSLLQLQAPGRPSFNAGYFAPGRPWVAFGMSTGVVYVVDAQHGVVIASADGFGQSPELAWMAGKDGAAPLLVVSTRNVGLSAYRVTGKPPSK